MPTPRAHTGAAVSRALRRGAAAVGLSALILLGVHPSAQAATPAPPGSVSTTAPAAATDTETDTGTGTPATGDLAPVCGAPAPGHAACFAMRDTRRGPTLRLSAGQAPAGLSPQDLQSAYALPSDGGAGQTIAIVDAYDDPSAEADLAVYRQQYGLPACTSDSGCFRKVDQRGGTSLPQTSDSWASEIALDLDMVSAAAPQAHILLVETDSDGLDALGAGVNEAVALGAKYVSNSYGRLGDFVTDQATYGAAFDHPGVAVVAATGDYGYGVSFPSDLATVTAVGGTTLTPDSGSARGWSEDVWQQGVNGPGSGCAANQPKPAFQTDTGCTGRSEADVSAVADDLAVYSTFGAYGNGWDTWGGTSAATPLITSIYALAGAPRPGSYPNAYPYATGGVGLNDITSGTNGDCAVSYLCTAGPGYDGPTGLGTPAGLAAFRYGPSGTLVGTVKDASTGEPIAKATVSDGVDIATTGADGTYSLSLPAGPASGLTVTAFGYTSSEPVTLDITADTTTTHDAALRPVPRRRVHGVVTDGSGHGWPLYARVSVEGSPEAPVWTDPVDGGYDLQLPQDAAYTLDISAVQPGYEPLARPVTVGHRTTTADAALTADPDLATAAGYALDVHASTESFDATTAAPQGWTVADAAGTGNGWEFDDPIQRGNSTGGTGAFAVVESDQGPFGPHQDTTLTSPDYDLSTAQSAQLAFRTAYISNPTQQHMSVDASADGGATWQTLWTNPKSSDSQDHLSVQVPLGDLAGRSSVRLRFHFQADWGYFWAIDDVGVTGRTLAPTPGGLVVGTVKDTAGHGVTGATVADASAPGTGVLSAATPQDPGVGDGLYTLFVPSPGRHALSVTAPGYRTATRQVTVHADRVTHRNVTLARST
ncbi:Carboxypeptidase regulatory-like domain-containing protein [Actinacidiphila yanglinensis]|uniref:Carboxypeptidase regulatory-like domain-containing protein n=1 Tax=Actinacidiphila yanglinensis TaxID=310779 RepID=A0A1H6E5H9_9ACTN|nr:carboxypeptidase regulatory-like domain-containing protein [Actinacidiphila yanglinensis]SEG92145.1 Carboxypeptidase regulatory-like domain-containing protein [Actinacidiphila yanglinensis]